MSKPQIANVSNVGDFVVINRFQDSDCKFTLNSEMNTRRGQSIDNFINEQQTRPSIIGIVGQVCNDMMSRESSESPQKMRYMQTN